MQLEEIRMNKYYSSLFISDYNDEESLEGGINNSTSVIRKRLMNTTDLFEKLKTIPSMKKSVEYKFDHLFPPNCRYY
jgi:hypothetical protein